MEREDLSMHQWLKHAQEEALDLAIYLEKVKRYIEVGAFHPDLKDQISGLCDRHIIEYKDSLVYQPLVKLAESVKALCVRKPWDKCGCGSPHCPINVGHGHNPDLTTKML
jgi:hypothetical protein